MWAHLPGVGPSLNRMEANGCILVGLGSQNSILFHSVANKREGCTMVPFSRSKRKFRCIRSRIVIRFMLDQRFLFWLCVLLLLPSFVQGSVILSVDAVL